MVRGPFVRAPTSESTLAASAGAGGKDDLASDGGRHEEEEDGEEEDLSGLELRTRPRSATASVQTDAVEADMVGFDNGRENDDGKA